MKLPKNEISGNASCPHCSVPLDVPTASIEQDARSTTRSRFFGNSSANPGFNTLRSPTQRKKEGSKILNKSRGLISSLTAKDLAGILEATDKSEKPASAANSSSSSNPNSHIPVARTEGPDVPKVRGENEAWEREPRALKDVDFKEKLGTTAEHTKVRDPAMKRKKKRRMSRAEQKARLESTGWDNGAERRGVSLKDRLAYVPWGLVGLLIALGGAAFYFGVLPQIRRLAKRTGPVTKVETTAPEPVDPNSLEKKAIFSLLPDANMILQRFFQCSTTKAMLQFVRDPSRVEPLMEKYYRENGEMKPIELSQPLAETTSMVHKQFLMGAIEYKDFSQHTVILEKTADGFRVDWESFVGYCDMSWDAFKKARPKEPKLFRAILKPTIYWNNAFTDQTKWRSYRLTDQDSQHTLWGYAELASETNDRISQALVGAPNAQINCVLMLSYPEDAKDDSQVQITKYLETGWAFREDDFSFALSASPALGHGGVEPAKPAKSVEPITKFEEISPATASLSTAPATYKPEVSPSPPPPLLESEKHAKPKKGLSPEEASIPDYKK
jgi:hypothetical protein